MEHLNSFSWKRKNTFISDSNGPKNIKNKINSNSSNNKIEL